MKILTSFVICMSLVFTSNYGEAQHNSTDKNAVIMLRDFYTKYIQVFADEPRISSERKLRALQQQYCSAALFNKIPRIIEQTDADPFLKAQDTDVQYLKTLVVSQSTQNKNEYIVSYVANTLPGRTATIVIHLAIVKEKNGYKISDVKMD